MKKTIVSLVLGIALFGSTGSQTSQGQSPGGEQPAAKLIVEPPAPELLAKGLVSIQYRTENVHILPVFGPAALAISPRIGHLHITVDDIIEPLRPDQVAKGLAYIHYRTENLQIAPVFGPDALKITPHVGHLHVRLDDASWGWTYASGQPVIVNGLAP
jgi:hypothetical protein